MSDHLFEKLRLLSLVYKIPIYLLGFLAVSLTVLPFFRFSSWWVRLGDFPRVQIAFVSIIIITLLLIFYRPLNNYNLAIILVLSLCFIYQVYCILPYIPIYRNQVEQTKQINPQKTIKLLISNVLIENNDSTKLLKLVKDVDPDVILLAEPNQHWMEELKSLDTDYPYSVKKPLDNAYGMALFSRLKLNNTEVKFLVEDDIPSIHTDIKLESGDTIKFFGVHPRPPIPGEATTSTERDAELVLVGKIVKNIKIPTIIAGDLNDVAWSRTTTLFRKVSGMLDPRIGRGFYSSFHADYPFMRFPLDHVFHSSHFRLVELKRLPYIGSDHFPLLIVLNIENDAEDSHNEPQANTNEMKQANQMIEDAEEKNNKNLPDVESNYNR
jgi:endonuclease/exonuclease/phosphatase (EEP) superfamily protein YafD